MTGHDFIKQLRGMEQKATKASWHVDLAKGYEHIWRFIRCQPPEGRPDDTYIAGTTGHRKDGVVAVLSGKTLIEEADNDARLIAELRNNADLLLSIAEAFQPGDCQRLRGAVVALYHADDRRFEAMLARLQAAAERLEESQLTADEINRLAKRGTTGEVYYRGKE